MRTSIVDQSIELLRRRWLTLLGVAVLALVPALVATSLTEVLGADASAAIVNGRLVPNEAADAWTTLLLSATLHGAELRFGIPLLLALGWVAALAVCMRVLVDASLWAAWRQAAARAVSWLLLGALLAALAVAALFASIFAASAFTGGLAGLVAVVTGIICLYGLARLALALPAMLIDGYSVVDAARRAVALTRGRVLRNGTVLIVAGIAVPALAFALAHAVAEALAPHLGGSFAADVAWVGAGSLVEHLALIAAVPVQAALLVGAYRTAAIPTADAPEPAPTTGSRTRWLAAAGFALLLAVPAVATSTVVLANPHRLPAATVAHSTAGILSRPLALTVLADGTTAVADTMQVGLCHDARCVDDGVVGMPCRDGAAPTRSGEGVRSCPIEAPLHAADITPDGTLLALEHAGAGQHARFFWCGVTRDQTCRWGGSTTLPALPESWSMAVAATPTGGFAAALLGPGKDERHGQLLLATCERLQCPQPTVHGVLDVAMPDAWQGGVVDIAVDHASGSLAVGYYDTTAHTLWLGGCPTTCVGGPALNRVGVWPASVPDVSSPFIPDLDTVATPTGPVAVITAPAPPDVSDAASDVEASTVIDCDDLSCTTSHSLGPNGWSSAALAVDSAGAAFLVASAAPGAPPALVNVHTGAFTALAGGGAVVAAAFGADDRLRMILDGAQGPVLVTCTTHHCVAP